METAGSDPRNGEHPDVAGGPGEPPAGEEEDQEQAVGAEAQRQNSQRLSAQGARNGERHHHEQAEEGYVQQDELVNGLKLPGPVAGGSQGSEHGAQDDDLLDEPQVANDGPGNPLRVQVGQQGLLQRYVDEQADQRGPHVSGHPHQRQDGQDDTDQLGPSRRRAYL